MSNKMAYESDAFEYPNGIYENADPATKEILNQEQGFKSLRGLTKVVAQVDELGFFEAQKTPEDWAKIHRENASAGNKFGEDLRTIIETVEKIKKEHRFSNHRYEVVEFMEILVNAAQTGLQNAKDDLQDLINRGYVSPRD